MKTSDFMKIFLIINLILFNLNCPDSTYINIGNFIIDSKNVDIYCEDDCSDCWGQNSQGEIIAHYPKDNNNYLWIYKKCDSILTNSGTAFLVECSECSDNRYAFDDHVINKKEGKFYPDAISYISLKAADYTSFWLRVSLRKQLFDDFFALISYNGADVSFSNSVKVDKIKIDTGLNKLSIYSLSGILEGRADFSVIGVKGNEEVCLYGDCGRRDKIIDAKFEAQVYRERIIDKCNMFYESTFDTSKWENEFNRVLKQSVVTVGKTFKKKIYNTWDLDTNHFLDRFQGTEILDPDLGDGFIDEFTAIIVQEGQIEKCPSNIESANFLIDERIRFHWIMIENPIPDGDGLVRKIKLNTVLGLIEDDTVHIGSYIDTNHHVKILIKYVDEIQNVVTIGLTSDPSKGVQNIYKTLDSVTIYMNDAALGFTLKSCSICRKSSTFFTNVHEFLHQERVAPEYGLKHVGNPYDSTAEKDNIMYPYSTIT